MLTLLFSTLIAFSKRLSPNYWFLILGGASFGMVLLVIFLIGGVLNSCHQSSFNKRIEQDNQNLQKIESNSQKTEGRVEEQEKQINQSLTERQKTDENINASILDAGNARNANLLRVSDERFRAAKCRAYPERCK